MYGSYLLELLHGRTDIVSQSAQRLLFVSVWHCGIKLYHSWKMIQWYATAVLGVWGQPSPYRQIVGIPRPVGELDPGHLTVATKRTEQRI